MYVSHHFRAPLASADHPTVFAPWCGHCKALAPEYEEAATTLKDKDIALAKVDCTEQQELCQSYGVEGYPTLKLFRGTDNVQPYQGPRKAASIVSYMTKQSLPPVSVIESGDSLEEFKTADKVVLVGYFAADDKSSNATFTTVAEELRDTFLFGATSDETLAKAEGVKQPAIVLYKQFDEGKSTFEDGFTSEAISEFAKTASTPLIGEVGPETYAGYMAVSAFRTWGCYGMTANKKNSPAFPSPTSSPRSPRSASHSPRTSSPSLRSTAARSTSLPSTQPLSVSTEAT